jgi:hypothetical protein
MLIQVYEKSLNAVVFNYVRKCARNFNQHKTISAIWVERFGLPTLSKSLLSGLNICVVKLVQRMFSLTSATRRHVGKI